MRETLTINSRVFGKRAYAGWRTAPRPSRHRRSRPFFPGLGLLRGCVGSSATTKKYPTRSWSQLCRGDGEVLVLRWFACLRPTRLRVCAHNHTRSCRGASKAFALCFGGCFIVGDTMQNRASLPLSQAPLQLPQRCPISNGRVAILLRGQAFRGATSFEASGPSNLQGCSPYADLQVQIEATQSLKANIISPLEALPCGNTVDIFLSECSVERGCPLVARLQRVLGRNIVASHTRCHSADQSKNVRMSLEFFKRAASKRVARDASMAAVGNAYDLFILTRHDIVWTRPISAWSHANFSMINFLGGCEPRCAGCEKGTCKHCPATATTGSRYGGNPLRCVQDSLHMMPGRAFSTFDTAVGSGGCFDGTNKGSGHRCLRPIESSAGSASGFVLPLSVWRPTKDVREASPVCHILVPLGASGRGNSSMAHPHEVLGQRPCHIAPADRLRLPVAIQRRMCGQPSVSVARRAP